MSTNVCGCQYWRLIFPEQIFVLYFRAEPWTEFIPFPYPVYSHPLKFPFIILDSTQTPLSTRLICLQKSDWKHWLNFKNLSRPRSWDLVLTFIPRSYTFKPFLLFVCSCPSSSGSLLAVLPSNKPAKSRAPLKEAPAGFAASTVAEQKDAQ